MDLKTKTQPYAARRDTPALKIHTVLNEGMEKDSPWKWKPKTVGNAIYLPDKIGFKLMRTDTTLHSEPKG